MLLNFGLNVYNAMPSFCLSFNYTAMASLNRLKSEIKVELHSFNFISLEKTIYVP